MCHLDRHFHEFLLLVAYSIHMNHSDRSFQDFLDSLLCFLSWLSSVMCFHAIFYCYNFPDFLFFCFPFSLLFLFLSFFTWVSFASLALFCVLGTTLQSTELYHNNLHLRVLSTMHCTAVPVALCWSVLLILFLSFLSLLLSLVCQCHLHFLLLLPPSPFTTPEPLKISITHQ